MAIRPEPRADAMVPSFGILLMTIRPWTLAAHTALFGPTSVVYDLSDWAVSQTSQPLRYSLVMYWLACG